MASSSPYKNTSLSYTSIYLTISKKHYSAEEVLQCLDEDSDSHFSNDNSESDENYSEIDVVSFNPMGDVFSETFNPVSKACKKKKVIKIIQTPRKHKPEVNPACTASRKCVCYGGCIFQNI